MPARKSLFLAIAVLCLSVAPASAGATSAPNAQLLSGNLFMGTTKVEAGARPWGTFGSTVAAPAGYHPRSVDLSGNPSSLLGFRANPDDCNWDTSACEATTQGDFFAPGAGYEVWGLRVGSSKPAWWNSDFGSPYIGIPGSFTSVDSSAPSARWVATAPYAGVQVRFDYSLPAYSWLINADVTLTNTTGSAINDIYFIRGVDPDNCRMGTVAGACRNAPLPGTPVTNTYETFNTVISNGPASGEAKVVATQTNGTYFSLQLKSTTAKAFQHQRGAAPADNFPYGDTENLASVYAGTDAQFTSTVGATVLGDQAMFVVEKIATLAAGESRTLPFKYVIKEGAPTSPPKELTVTTSGSGSGTVTSSPSGINCGSTCSHSFDDGTSVTLTANVPEGSVFAGWGGACSGTALTCTVSMTEARTVTATFNKAPAPSNAFTVNETGSVGGVVVSRVTLPGPGAVWQVGTRSEGGRTVPACRAYARYVSSRRTMALICRANSGTNEARKKSAVKVRVCTTFRPTGGTAKRTCRTATLPKLRGRPGFTG